MDLENNFSKERFPFCTTICDDEKSLARAFVDLFEVWLKKRSSDSLKKPIGLATGMTMKPIYNELTSRLNCWDYSDLARLREDWTSFNLDEYIGLDADDSRSFFSFMSTYLFEPLELRKDTFFIPNGKSDNHDGEAFDYSKKLDSFGGIGLLILGLGSNGHIGFNEPPCEAESICRVVQLSTSTKEQNSQEFDFDIEKVPNKAITLGLSDILNSDEIHLIVTGARKSSILRDLLNSSTTEDIPASWLRLHRRVFLWADSAAFN